MRRVIQEAEGYLALEMYGDAWKAIDELPIADRSKPEALRIRLLAATGLRAWESAESLAEFLTEICLPILRSQEQIKPCPLREAVGLFRLAHAQMLFSVMNFIKARAEVRRLFQIWPEGRKRVTANPGLHALLWENTPPVG